MLRRAVVGLPNAQQEGLRTFMRGMSTIPVKRRFRIVTTLSEDVPFHPKHISSTSKSTTDSIEQCAPQAAPSINETKKKAFKLVAREPKSTLDHAYRYTPTTKPPTPLVVLERAVLDKNYAKAVEAFDTVPSSDLNRFAYEWAMQSHVALGNYAEVVRLFEEAEKTIPMLHNRLRFYYILSLNRQSRFADSLDVFVDWHVGEVAPLSRPIYNALLVACSHLKEWKTAQTIYHAMLASHLTPNGPTYFHVITTAIKSRPKCPQFTILSLAEATAAAGYPISVTLLNHILVDASSSSSAAPPLSSPSSCSGQLRVAAIRRALQLWDANKHYDALPVASEVPYEIALQQIWDAKLYTEAVGVVEDLVRLPSPSAAFKFRIAKMLLSRAAPVHADMSIKLLDLMQIHELGRLSGMARYRLFAGWSHLLEIEDIAAFFVQYQDVTHGWNGSRVSDLFIFGYRHFIAKGGHSPHEFQRVMRLFTFAFESGDTLSYVALEHAVRWLYDMGKANEALQIIVTMRGNPDLPLGYRLTELGMFIASKKEEYDVVIDLFEDLQSRGRTHKGDELHPKRFMVKMATKAYGETQNLIKFQELRYILSNHEYKHWQGDPAERRPRGRMYV
ncbi:hypothetical protein DYB35_010708 [Aphanomyces astaci]|uniref:Pentacotripeptide-repeat region of PRORP domain-containing protein n=1 Tax=Aphanomyces astaci TaxID=112090 RepID=A0A3R7BA66_APHAT|nr:hypothetical protein DYB35_010708 [Aphanomyces astaci]